MSDHETASFFDRVKKGLDDSIAYSRGQLSLRTTALPLPPPPASPRRVAALRRKLKMSQSVFAATLNVSPKLVQSWEQGSRRPGRGDLRLLQIIEQRPQLVGELFAIGRPGTRPARPSPPPRSRRGRAVA
jgi:putative transcriptional regulator